MILVTGAGGNVGGELVRELLDAGERVRVLTRSAAPRPWPAGVDVVTGDLDRPDTVAPAMRDAAGVFLLPGYRDMPGLLAAAERAKVERVVLLSGRSAGSGDMSNAITRYMATSEAAVRSASTRWTILRPTSFMSNAYRWLPQLRAGEVLRLPFGSVRSACVDPADIAAVAAVALLEPGHEGKIYEPTGPESLTKGDQVEIMSTVLGRALRFEALPDEVARQELLKTTPAEYADAFIDFYVRGSLDESEILPTVEDVTGRPPGTFAAWVDRHAAAFRSSD